MLKRCSHCHISLEQLECGLKAAFNTQTAHVFRKIAKTGGPLAMIQSAEQFADYSVKDFLADCAAEH
ncbi:hypothetical protein TYRP_008571 [Tyrophagus putrescentiae]|nr:hypothetical protein TYRP_008571 [Tyrophagus putrescentiae]